MATGVNAPAGFRGTRGEILTALKRAQPLTAKELASKFGVTPNALRRHLKELEAEGIVRYQREIRGVGGPVFAFSLTEAGEALFPRAYEKALAEVLDLISGESGSYRAGQRLLLRGSDLAPVERDAPEPPFEDAGRPTQLAGISVRFGDRWAPVWYVSHGEIVVEVPAGLEVDNAEVVVVAGPGIESKPVTVPLTR